MNDALVDPNKAAGRWLALGAGTYYLKQPLLLPTGAKIAGLGASSVLVFCWTYASHMSGTGNGSSDIQGKDPSTGDNAITLENFVIDGDATGYPTGPTQDYGTPPDLVHGIRLSDVGNVTIRKLEIRHTSGFGILYRQSGISATYGMTITGNFVHNTGRDGITGDWDDTAGHYGAGPVDVTNNLIADVGDDGIAFNGDHPTSTDGWVSPIGLTASGNQIEGWPDGSLTAARKAKILGRGMFVQNVGGNVDQPSSPTVTIAGNVINRTESDGILVTSPWVSATAGTTNCDHPAKGVNIATNTITAAGANNVGGDSNLDKGYGIYIHDEVDRDQPTAQLVSASGNTITGSRGVDLGAPVPQNPDCP